MKAYEVAALVVGTLWPLCSKQVAANTEQYSWAM